MTNRTDKTSGEIVIIRRPHQMPCKVTVFYSFDEAFDAYRDDFFWAEHKNLAGYIDDSGFDKEMDKEMIEEMTVKIQDEGIADNEPFIEFYLKENEPEFYKASDFSKEDALDEAIRYDMHGAERLDAEEGETYGEFADRIFSFYAGGVHNAPSKAQIERALMIED